MKTNSLNISKMDNTLVTLVGKERLEKDVDNLMNSLYWVEALKNQSAKGISNKLNSKKILLIITFMINVDYIYLYKII